MEENKVEITDGSAVLTVGNKDDMNDDDDDDDENTVDVNDDTLPSSIVALVVLDVAMALVDLVA